MEKVKSAWPDGSETWAYPERKWYAAVVAYWHDLQYRRYLKHCYAEGLSPEDAIEALRRELGAKTRLEREAIRADRAAEVQAAREAHFPNPVGRPARLMEAAEFKTRVAAAIMKEIAKCSVRRMTPECKELVESTKRQVLGA